MFNNFHTLLNVVKFDETVFSSRFSTKFVCNVCLQHLSKTTKQILKVDNTQILRQIINIDRKQKLMNYYLKSQQSVPILAREHISSMFHWNALDKIPNGHEPVANN